VYAEQNRFVAKGFPEPPQRRHVVKGAMSHKCAKAIFWQQDVIRRAAHAMREARSNDLYVLARVALLAAIRDEIDLLELLPAPTRAPAESTPAEAVALA
jgi:restriction endonuclease Mrr